jgi:hypothetical protein
MKNFKQYLAESAKTYGFRITFAGKPVDGIEKIVKQTLAGYQPTSVSSLKSHPVQRNHPLFPKIENPEVYSLDVACDYPASADQIRVALTQGRADKLNVAVQNLIYAQSQDAEHTAVAANTGETPLLMRPYETSQIQPEDIYGSDYNSKLVKNSVSGVGKPHVDGSAKPALTTNDLPQGKKSAMGSVKPKLPDVKSYRR